MTDRPLPDPPANPNSSPPPTTPIDGRHGATHRLARYRGYVDSLERQGAGGSSSCAFWREKVARLEQQLGVAPGGNRMVRETFTPTETVEFRRLARIRRRSADLRPPLPIDVRLARMASLRSELARTPLDRAAARCLRRVLLGSYTALTDQPPLTTARGSVTALLEGMKADAARAEEVAT